MSVKVQTLYLAKFEMPEACVVCGSSPLPGAKWKVSGSKTEQKWSSTEYHTLNLEFPLCPDCKEASQKKFLGRLVYRFGVLLFSLLCFTSMGLLASSTYEDPFTVIGIGIGICLAVWVLAKWLSSKIHERGLSPVQRERRKQVHKSAQIKKFDKKKGILFIFENPKFAQEFALLNMGSLV